LLAFLLLSYNKGDRVTPEDSRPVDWVSSVWGYCGDFQYEPVTEKGSGEDFEVIPYVEAAKTMRKNNRRVRRCNAKARSEGRNYSTERSNLLAMLLLMPSLFVLYEAAWTAKASRRKRKQAEREGASWEPGSPPFWLRGVKRLRKPKSKP